MNYIDVTKRFCEDLKAQDPEKPISATFIDAG